MSRSFASHYWITDGVTSVLHAVTIPLPDGWRRGRVSVDKIRTCVCQQCGSNYNSFRQKPSDDGVIRCKPCASRKTQQRHLPKQRDKWLRQTYGITLLQYEAMLVLQNSVCAICTEPEVRMTERGDRLAFLTVDHDHDTGQVRALLCSRCNSAIGLFREDVDILTKSIRYIQEHKEAENE